MSKFNSTKSRIAVVGVVTYLLVTIVYSVLGWFGYFRGAKEWEGVFIGLIYPILLLALIAAFLFILVKVLKWIFKDDDI